MHILERLVANSRAALDDKVYDVAVSLPNSGLDLIDEIKTARHAALIAEIKFASPSAGNIGVLRDPVDVAHSMVAGGACALSVLTQPHLFGGSPEYFVRVRQKVRVPMLMKDIIIDTAQIDAAHRIGADYILLIQSVFGMGLADGDQLISHAHKKGLGVLLEVHTSSEFESALSGRADLIGINNRNLDTMEVDLGTTKRILSGYDGNAPIVSESGILHPDDIRTLHDAGARAFLVGSGIMGADDAEAKVQELVGAH